MGRRRKNTFAKALGQLKSTKIDEKLQILSERPTNSVMTYMTTTPSTLNPDFVSSQRGQDSALQFIQPDFDQDDPDQNGQDTTGLFEADGTPRTALPPGDTSYILGPMSAMWYGWANQTRIGYIREADRKMVNLGMISGTLDAWDGASNFTSFGQLTLEQAVWFKDVEKAPGQSNDPTTYNYRAFYPGPPSTTKDSFGRYYCVITGKAKSNPLSGVGEKEQIPGAGGKATADDNFSALLDRLIKSADQRRNLAKLGIGAQEWWDSKFGGNQLAATGAKLTWGIMDNILFGNSNYLLKGIPAGFKFSTDWIGAGPKNSRILNSLPKYKGQKLVDWADDILSTKNFKPNFVKNIVGKNYYGQWFTDPTMVDVATGYAGKGGSVSLVPRTQGKWGWKNWFSSNTSRSIGGQPETFQRADDLVNALKGGKGRLDLAVDNPKTQKLLTRYATKVATNSKTLKMFARGIPLLGAGISAVDAASRFSKGDWKGGTLSLLSMVPGPAGWAALGAQVAVDTGAVEKGVEFMYNRQTGFNPETSMYEPRTMKGSRSRFREAVEDQNNKIGNMNLEEAKQQMIKMGVPLDNPEELANEMGLMMLGAGMNPEIVEIAQLAIVGAKLTKKQQKDIEEKMMKMSAVLVAGERAKETKPQNAQESLELLESRKMSILKNLKNPVVIPETKQKSYKVKPKIRGLNSAIISKPVETPKEYQPKGGRNLWGQYEYNRNVKQSQERKNEVLDLVGEGEQAFKYMLNDSRAMNAQQLEKFWGLHPELYSYFYNGKKFKAIRKEALDGDFLVFLVDENGVKSNILQSELNEKLVEDEDRKALEEYNKLNPKPKRNDRISFEKDYLFKKAYQKLKKEVDYDDKPARMGYPNDPPPKMVNDRHPDFGKRPGTTMFNKLDPSTAAATPKQDDPTIDAKVEKAKNNPDKDGSNWRKELEVKIKKHRQSIK